MVVIKSRELPKFNFSLKGGHGCQLEAARPTAKAEMSMNWPPSSLAA
jgi:hypothetical protein